MLPMAFGLPEDMSHRSVLTLAVRFFRKVGFTIISKRFVKIVI